MNRDLEIVLRAAARLAARPWLANPDAPLVDLAAELRKLHRRQRERPVRGVYDPVRDQWRVELVAAWLAVYDATHEEHP